MGTSPLKWTVSETLVVMNSIMSGKGASEHSLLLFAGGASAVGLSAWLALPPPPPSLPPVPYDSNDSAIHLKQAK